MTHPQEQGTCALCGSDVLASETARYVSCGNCSTISQSHPRHNVKAEYPDEMYKHPLSPQEKRWLGLIEQCGPEGKTLLDLGCGSGSFMSLAAESGWRVQGVEKNVHLSDDAREGGLSVTTADLDRWVCEDENKWDVVRIWYVLEHVMLPGRLLRTVIKTLRAGGFLTIAVPNDAGWLSRLVMKDVEDRFWEHPLHMHHFPPFGLERWLEELGFEIILAEAARPTELMRSGKLPLDQAWERARETAPELSRIFYELGVGRGRELILKMGRNDE